MQHGFDLPSKKCSLFFFFFFSKDVLCWSGIAAYPNINCSSRKGKIWIVCVWVFGLVALSWSLSLVLGLCYWVVWWLGLRLVMGSSNWAVRLEWYWIRAWAWLESKFLHFPFDSMQMGGFVRGIGKKVWKWVGLCVRDREGWKMFSKF